MADILRVSEVYTSIQGEGPNVGKPTQFVRFGGCNLRCPGWPCDTQHAIDPQYRNEWERHTPESLLELVDDWPKRVTLTGGEPFLQQKDALDGFIHGLSMRGYEIDCFTNGTLEWPICARNFGMQMILDWKLPGSGEDHLDHQRAVNWRSEFDTYVKFTIADEEDYVKAGDIASRHGIPYKRIYLGVAWGRLKESELAEWIFRDELDVKLNVQVHNYIWDREQRGI